MKNTVLMRAARHEEYMARAKELAEAAREGATLEVAIFWLEDVFEEWKVESLEIAKPLPEVRADFKITVVMKRKGERFRITGRGNTGIAAVISSVYDGTPIDLSGVDVVDDLN